MIYGLNALKYIPATNVCTALTAGGANLKQPAHILRNVLDSAVATEGLFNSGVSPLVLDGWAAALSALVLCEDPAIGAAEPFPVTKGHDVKLLHTREDAVSLFYQASGLIFRAHTTAFVNNVVGLNEEHITMQLCLVLVQMAFAGEVPQFEVISRSFNQSSLSNTCLTLQQQVFKILPAPNDKSWIKSINAVEHHKHVPFSVVREWLLQRPLGSRSLQHTAVSTRARRCRRLRVRRCLARQV